MNDKLTLYVDRRGKHRWRLVAPNGRVRCASTQGFATKRIARTNFVQTRSAMLVQVV